MRRFIRVLGLAAGVGAVVYLMRDKLVRIPEDPEPPPRFRAQSPNGETADPAVAAAVALADDLTEITGIGPAYAGRLRDAGITSFVELAEVDVPKTAEVIDVSPEQVADWVEQARTRTR